MRLYITALYFFLDANLYVSDLLKDEILKLVGIRIKKIRLKQKLSRYQLAFEIKTSEKLIRQIENGEINTSIFKIFQIAEALGVKPEELLKVKEIIKK